MTLSIEALLLLDRIEAIEMRSLAWGFTSGSLAEDEMLELIGGGAPCRGRPGRVARGTTC